MSNRTLDFRRRFIQAVLYFAPVMGVFVFLLQRNEDAQSGQWLALLITSLPVLCFVFLPWYFICHLFLEGYIFKGYAFRLRLMIQADEEIRPRLERVWQGDYEGFGAKSEGKTTHRHIAVALLRKEVIPLLLKAKPWWTYGDVNYVWAPKDTITGQFKKWKAESRSGELHPGDNTGSPTQVGYFVVTICLYGFDKIPGLDPRQLSVPHSRDMEQALQKLLDVRDGNLHGCSLDWCPYVPNRVLTPDRAFTLFPDLKKL